MRLAANQNTLPLSRYERLAERIKNLPEQASGLESLEKSLWDLAAFLTEQKLLQEEKIQRIFSMKDSLDDLKTSQKDYKPHCSQEKPSHRIF